MEMNDYKRIRSSLTYRKLSPKNTRAEHLRSVVEIRKSLTSHDPKKSVMITHHAPSMHSLPDRRKEEPVSCAYASNLDDLIEEFQPALWIHGHIHHSQDYRIGGTRVIANPRGYIDDPNPNFNPELVVEV